MTWRLRSAVVALALFALGIAGAGVSLASTFAPGAAASGPAAGTPDESSRVDPFNVSAVADGTGPCTAPGTGTGNAFTGEDGSGDDDPRGAGTATVPRDGSFAAVFDESQDFSEPSFLAPPTRGPPAA